VSPTVYLLHATSKAAKAWTKKHISENATKLGDAIAVEHRYIEDIVSAMLDSGFKVGIDFLVQS